MSFITEKLCLHDFGWKIALGIESKNKTDIERRFYSFWNHGATTGELVWLNSEFAYFWSTKSELLKSLTGAALFNLLNTNPLEFKGKQFGAMPKAREIGKQIFDNIPRGKVVDISKISDTLSKFHGNLE
jgi:hypothetical protein